MVLEMERATGAWSSACLPQLEPDDPPGAILIVNIPVVRMGKRTADLLERFGQRVRELRKAQGYSQETFSAACALDRTYIGGIERGERNLDLRNIEAIARTLGISLSELMGGL